MKTDRSGPVKCHSLTKPRSYYPNSLGRTYGTRPTSTELPQWVLDEGAPIRRPPTFPEIRFRAALRELDRVQSGYGNDVPGLRGCIKQVRAAITRATIGRAPYDGQNAPARLPRVLSVKEPCRLSVQ
jgi:hypothetical protein